MTFAEAWPTALRPRAPEVKVIAGRSGPLAGPSVPPKSPARSIFIWPFRPSSGSVRKRRSVLGLVKSTWSFTVWENWALPEAFWPPRPSWPALRARSGSSCTEPLTVKVMSYCFEGSLGWMSPVRSTSRLATPKASTPGLPSPSRSSSASASSVIEPSASVMACCTKGRNLPKNLSRRKVWTSWRAPKGRALVTLSRAPVLSRVAIHELSESPSWPASSNSTGSGWPSMPSAGATSSSIEVA